MMEHTEEILTEATEAAKKPAKRTKTAAKRTRKAAEETVAAKPAAKSAAMKPELYIQCDGNQFDISGVVDAAKAAFKAEHSRVAVKSCQIYVKPQERAAYYVINGDFTGKLDL